jgi:hypothetical protein
VDDRPHLPPEDWWEGIQPVGYTPPPRPTLVPEPATLVQEPVGRPETDRVAPVATLPAVVVPIRPVPPPVDRVRGLRLVLEDLLERLTP